MSEVPETPQPEPSLYFLIKTWLKSKLSSKVKNEVIITSEGWLKRHWHLIYIIPLIVFCYYYIQIDTQNNNNQSLQITNQQENLIVNV